MIDSPTRLAKNSLWMILSRFGAQGLAVVFTILLARRLGSEGFGEYAFIAAVIFIANALTTFGTDMLLIREVAAKDDLSRLPLALILQLLLSGVSIALVWMFAESVPNQSSEAVTALKIYSLALIPLAFFTVFTTALRGVQRMDAYASINILFSLLQVGAVLLLHEKDLILLSTFLLSTQIIAAFFAGLVCSMYIRRFWQAFRLSSLLLSSQLLSFLQEAAPIAVLALLGIIYQRLNIYLLSTMSGAAETGIYSAAFRAVEASKTAHLAIFAALYPAMASAMSLRVFEKQSPDQTGGLLRSLGFDTPKEHGLLNQRSLAMTYPKLLFAGATLISLLLFILAKPLVIFLYGSEFLASSNILQILAWTLIPFTLNTYLTLSLLASGRERLVGRALAVSLLGLLVLNLWWIPAKGPQGSAWAALAAECLQSVVLLASARSFVHLQGEAREFSELS